jgi:hypothetical protein
MLSPRLAFMKIHEAPITHQLKIRGNVCLVPADVTICVNQLPRINSESATIPFRLKRRSQYKHAFLTVNTCPDCIREVWIYLTEHGPLFRQEKISFNTTQLDDLSLQSSSTQHQKTVSNIVEDSTPTEPDVRGTDNDGDQSEANHLHSSDSDLPN